MEPVNTSVSNEVKQMLRQAIRFGGVGVINTAVGLAVIYAAMFFFGAGAAVANLAGYAVGLAISFGLNRSWTFRSNGRSAHQLPRFVLVTILSYAANLCAVLLATAQAGIDPYAAQLLGAPVYTLASFFGCRWFVFGPGGLPAQAK